MEAEPNKCGFFVTEKTFAWIKESLESLTYFGRKSDFWTWEDTYNNLPNDCDILYLGLNSLHLKITGIPKKINPFVANLIPIKPKNKQKKFKYGIVYGSHALLINKKVAIEWLKAAYPIKWPSDWVFGKLIFESKKLKGYCCDLIEASSDYKVDSSTELM